MIAAAGGGPRVRRDITGILLLDKPAGISSNAALQRARARFRASKAGHTGNLDVAASGLLPVCLGEATKVCGWLLDADKVYDATVRLGVRTATGDAEGEVLEQKPVTPGMRQRLPELLSSFLGARQQVPPMYSALKRDGRPLYELARAGIEVDRAPRKINVHSLELLATAGDTATLRVKCSKGTYIRVLAEEIGEALGCGASLEALRRLAAGPFSLDQAVTLDELWSIPSPLEAFDRLLLPADTALGGIPAVVFAPSGARSLKEGRSVPLQAAFPAGVARAYETDGRFVGLVEIGADGRAAPRRIFGRVLGMSHQS